MNKRERTLLSLYTPDGLLRPFLWFRSHKKNEIIWVPYGLKTDSPVLCAEWPEEEEPVPTERNLKKYFFAERINRNTPIDHITSHADGTFHIKGFEKPPIYQHTMKMKEPLSRHTGPFLEFIALTEVATEYRPRVPKGVSSTLPIKVLPDGGVTVYVAIAGAQFPMKEFLADGLLLNHSVGPTFMIGQYQAGFTFCSTQPNLDLTQHRPHGTFIIFQFHMQSGNVRHKMFLFE